MNTQFFIWSVALICSAGALPEPLGASVANFMHLAQLNGDEACGAALYADAHGGAADDEGGASHYVGGGAGAGGYGGHGALELPSIGSGSHYHGNNKNFPLLDAVCRRLGRRAGRLPDWYPVAWKRNIRRSFRYFSSVQDEK